MQSLDDVHAFTPVVLSLVYTIDNNNHSILASLCVLEMCALKRW